MTAKDRAIWLAREEITRRTFAVTRQCLAVHQVTADTDGAFAVSRVDDTTTPGSYGVYFPIEDEPYHCVVEVGQSASGDLRVSWVYMQPAIRVYFMIRSKDLTPDQLTSSLGLSPTRKRARGEPHGLRKTSEHVWQLEPQEGVPGGFDEKLKVLLDKVEPATERIAALAPTCTVVLSVVYEGWGGNPQFGGLHIDQESIRRIRSLGAALDLDLYASGPPMLDEEDAPDSAT